MARPLAKGTFLLQKFPGKGGWTYAEIPGIPKGKGGPFGWVTVKGSIDDYKFKHLKLMPMGNGRLFFSVNAGIRKAIGKKAGDTVKITLYLDTAPLEIPEELLACFELEPKEVLTTFRSFTDGERKAYINWIYSANKEETKADRILTMMERLGKGLRFGEPEK